MRVEGKIRFLSDERFTPEDAEALLGAILSAEEIAAFKVLMEKDVAFVVPGVGRFRANLFVQRRRYGFVFRHVQERVPHIEDLHLPVAPLTKLSRLHRGIVLVTGIAGSGKSTTLSALVEHMTRSSSSSATSGARSPSARSASTRPTTRRR
jgi:Tfp pilus assembly pilus retraction ATPase PilT